MKKRLIALLLVLVTVLGMLPATALAAGSEEEALGEVNIYNGGQKLAYLSINGRIREQIYTYFNYVDSQGRTKEIPAYCVNPNTKGVPQSVAPGESIKYLAEEKGNDPKVMGILLHKVDADTGKGIYGATFLLYDSNHNPIGQYTTDQNGYIYMDEGLADGRYYLREIQAADGYILDTQLKTIYVQYGATSEITWENTAVRGQIQIIKKSADDNSINGLPAGTLLEGAVFEVYDKAGNKVDTIRTDRNGRAVSKLLPLSRYTIREVSAPAYYAVNPTVMTAYLEYEGQIVTFEVLDSSVATGVSITKTGPKEVMPGQPIRYTLKDIANTSTVPLSSFYWRDTLPGQMTLNQIVTGTYNQQLSYGLRRIDAVRTLTSESTAVLMPFKSQEIQDAGGIYYGVNPISHNLIICNRGSLMNGNGFIFGVSGSGKSMAAKQEITTLALATDHDIIIIDPEREYGPLVRALGGEIITISASSDTYINAMDISSEYGGGQNPLALKSDFIMSLCEQIMGAEQISARDKSIIDRCTANVYREYIKTYKGDPPTLKDLHDDLMRQKEPAAHDIALALELFTTGTLDVFAHQTNVNSRNRILCFDIQDLGENLKPIGLLVMLDAIMNRVIANRAEGKYTHVYIDEIYLFFAGSSMGGAGDNVSKYSAEFLYKCWKRFRKYYATLTGITQNVEECLRSDTARMMFANSEFLLMFNQAPNDREVLAHILNASSAQMSYVSDKPPGHGLIKVGGAIVPLVNEFPKDTSLYWLMTTKPGEG